VTNRGDRLGKIPAAYVEGAWDEGRFTDEATTAVRYVWLLSRRLAVALEGRQKSAFANEVGVARSTIHDFLTGRTWPDVPTVARLEEVLGETLWPSLDDVQATRSRRKSTKRSAGIE
jgi:hypothetical protein